jgi:hypothetical protein
MHAGLPGSEIGQPNGCMAAVVIVVLYVGCVLGGLYWLFRYFNP